MKRLKKIISKRFFTRNKYWIAIAAFIVWIAFFDQYDLGTIFRLRNDLQKMEHDKMYYEREIESTNSKLEELNSNIDAVEKYARENYYMKKEDEDIFIIVKPKE